MRNTFSRRAFARLVAALAGSSSVPSVFAELPEHSADNTSNMRSFPADFLWGSATASYQVEGGVHEGGRGPSIWDTFSHRPGAIANGDTGDVSTDHYHRYKQDIALMKQLGLETYRFSVSWSRIFPTGAGAPNPQGLDFYNRLVDELLANNIQPFCTLYHWDLPQALQDKGGWENRDTAQAFADYAGYISHELADRVHRFMTMNEIRSFVELGYQQGTHAPGLKLDVARVAQLNHYAVLGHGLAVQSIRASTRPDTQVGIADNPQAATPLIEISDDFAAARAMREQNAQYLTVICEGQYTDHYLRSLGAAAPKFTAEEMKIIGSPLDFIGLNIYQPTYVRTSASELGYEVVTPPASFPHMYSPWLYVGPEAIYWATKLVTQLWKPKEIFITENGASSSDVLQANNTVIDSDRIMYLRNYLGQLHRAVSEGVPVKGYFVWSLLDNFEWADGYSKRFGIVYVDYPTQRRIPKMSAKFYHDVIARGGLA
ncbi:MAG TPA: GH1 family beta-glucosidase [Candidatus Aquilonibacter sp.]|nr:GH1 family beta-glucosidase [Candidatus Aquilonibacter sp.]